MLLAVDALFDTMFGSVLPSWFALDSIQYLIGIIIFSVVVSVIINFIKRR